MNSLTKKLSEGLVSIFHPLSASLTITNGPFWRISQNHYPMIGLPTEAPVAISSKIITKRLVSFVVEAVVTDDYLHDGNDPERYVVHSVVRDLSDSYHWFDPETLNMKYTSGIEQHLDVQSLGEKKPKINRRTIKALFKAQPSFSSYKLRDPQILCSFALRAAMDEYLEDFDGSLIWYLLSRYRDENAQILFYKADLFQPVSWLPDDLILITDKESLHLFLEPGEIEEDRDYRTLCNHYVLGIKLAAHFMSPTATIEGFIPESVFVFSIRGVKRRLKRLYQRCKSKLSNLYFEMKYRLEKDSL